MHKLFPSQQPDEKIYIVVREHWILLAGKLAMWCVFIIVYALFKKKMPELVPGLFEGDFAIYTQLFLQVYALFLTASLFLIWMLYYLNIQVITDRRIVDIDQIGLFSHTISELHIENIEDVTSETNGILGNIFDFGMVYVQTAGTQERFEFNNVPNPGLVNKTILDLYEKLPHHKAGEKGKD